MCLVNPRCSGCVCILAPTRSIAELPPASLPRRKMWGSLPSAGTCGLDENETSRDRFGTAKVRE